MVADDGWVDYSDTVDWEGVRLAEPAKVILCESGPHCLCEPLLGSYDSKYMLIG